MSITFYASKFDSERGYHARMFRCDCAEHWGNACDTAWAKDEDAPDMYSCENCTGTDINIANPNAADLLAWLGVDFDHCGTVDARDLAAKCRRRLWDETRNHDGAVSGHIDSSPGRCTVVYNGRRPGYLREITEHMLVIAKRAGENSVSWG